ncbi:MAG: GNAT family protein [Salinivirgaceae bacterium]|jgi:diamine N-acetyltransferase|nr:GNAT family protein [Salinivirgaceae bacterium]
MSNLLKSEGIELRALEPEDLEFLYSCENNSEIWNVSNTLAPFSKYILRQYIKNSHHDIYTNKQLRLIISNETEPNKAIGAIDLFDFDPYHMRAGVGILIHGQNNQSKGLASSALKTLINYCFNHLHFNQLYCNIGAANTKSIHLFEKCGFIKCGEKKQWLRTTDGFESELMFQLLN